MTRTARTLRTTRSLTALTALTAATGLAAVTLTGCTSDDVAPLQEASLGDAVIAMRYVTTSYDMLPTESPEYLLLVNAHGSTETVELRPMEIDSMVWDTHGLFYGSRSAEVQLTEDAAVVTDRRTEHTSQFDHESLRIPEVTGDGYFAFYPAETPDHSFGSLMVRGTTSGIEQHEIAGTYMDAVQCPDQRIFGTTSIIEVVPEATEDLDVLATGMALVQVWPAPGSAPTSGVVAQFVTSAEQYYEFEPAAPGACQDDQIFHLTTLITQPEAEHGEADWLLGSHLWDLSTGEYEFIPLHTPDGEEFLPSPEDLVIETGHLIAEDEYLWITDAGEIFVTDPATGLTTQEGSLEIDTTGYAERDYTFIDGGILILEVPAGSDTAELTRYDLDTGERSPVIDIEIPEVVREADYLSLRDVAIDPEWDSRN